VTPVKKLKLLTKKEDYEIKRKNEEKFRNKQDYRSKSKKKYKSPLSEVEYPDDHLPFKTMLIKIAASMPGHPLKPKFDTKFKPE
jgi:hypothetical protein